MSKELVVSSNRHETKVAILEDDQLVEVYFQRQQEYSLGGSIHKGRVTRVLPGMQSAFVDIGLERDAFLYVSEVVNTVEEFERLESGDEEDGEPSDTPAPVAVIIPAVDSDPEVSVQPAALPPHGVERRSRERVSAQAPTGSASPYSIARSVAR